MRGLTRSLFSGGIGLARQRKDRWTRSPWIILAPIGLVALAIVGGIIWLVASRSSGTSAAVSSGRNEGGKKVQAKLTVKMSPSTSEPARPAKFPASKSSAGAAEATKAGRPKDVADWRLDDYHQRQAQRRSAVGGRHRLPGRPFFRQRKRRDPAGGPAGACGGRSVRRDGGGATVKSGRGNARISISFLQQADSETHRGHNRRPGGQRNAARPANSPGPRRRLAQGGRRTGSGHRGVSRARRAAWPGRPRLPIPHGHGGGAPCGRGSKSQRPCEIAKRCHRTGRCERLRVALGSLGEIHAGAGDAEDPLRSTLGLC